MVIKGGKIMNKKEMLFQEILNKMEENSNEICELIKQGIITNETEEIEYRKEFMKKLNDYKEQRIKELGIEDAQ